MKAFANALLDSSAAAAARRPDDREVLGGKEVDDPQAQRNLRADDRQVDMLPSGGRQERGGTRVGGNAASDLGDAWIAGGAQNFRHGALPGELPCKGVLPGAARR